MVKKRRILIIIPEDELSRAFGWFRKGMDEWAIRAYLIKQPGIVEEGLSLQHFIGFNIYFQNKQEVDMLFGKNGTYYVIETKQKGKYYQGWKYLAATVDSFEAEMNERKEPLEEIVAVLATSSIRQEHLSAEKLDWFEEPLE